MAGRTRRGDVSARERKACRGVVEFSCRPGRDRMARRAHGGSAREASSNVIRNSAANGGCAVPGGRMAAHAVGRIERVIIVYMA